MYRLRVTYTNIDISRMGDQRPTYVRKYLGDTVCSFRVASSTFYFHNIIPCDQPSLSHLKLQEKALHAWYWSWSHVSRDIIASILAIACQTRTLQLSKPWRGGGGHGWFVNVTFYAVPLYINYTISENVRLRFVFQMTETEMIPPK